MKFLLSIIVVLLTACTEGYTTVKTMEEATKDCANRGGVFYTYTTNFNKDIVTITTVCQDKTHIEKRTSK